MKICYIVYREDNVMVFDSQVLEYLKIMRSKVENIELIVFRHEKNLFHKSALEAKIMDYVDECTTYMSAPVLSTLQLKFNAMRLKLHILRKYSSGDVAVICRGDLAGYVGTLAFRRKNNARVLLDNRGLPIEESIMSYGDRWTHKINRRAKAYAMNYAKDHCDAYNFVTTRLREHDIATYGYRESLPYTIIPTLFKKECVDDSELERIRKIEQCASNDFTVTYIGSTAAWQETENLPQIIRKIYEKKSNSRFFILTNGKIEILQELPESLRQRIVVKRVPHGDVKYYLALSDVGIAIRDNNVVNRVAAPTKIAEYVTSGVQLLYSGNIGILSDLKALDSLGNMIDIDENPEWDTMLVGRRSQDDLSVYIDYFDMDNRQNETLQMLKECFIKDRAISC